MMVMMAPVYGVGVSRKPRGAIPAREVLRAVGLTPLGPRTSQGGA